MCVCACAARRHVNKLSMEIEMERYEVAELQQELETYTGKKSKEATNRKNILETLEKLALEASPRALTLMLALTDGAH